MNPKELRVNEPVGRMKHGIHGTKPFDSDRMCDLEILLTESKIKIYVGKRKYSEVGGEVSDAEGALEIDPHSEARYRSKAPL